MGAKDEDMKGRAVKGEIQELMELRERRKERLQGSLKGEDKMARLRP